MKTIKYKTDTWEFDANNNILTYHNKQIKLRNHLAKIMYMMCSSHDQYVTHDQMISEVWDGNYIVGLKSIRNTIWELRKHVPEIKTVPKKGYQLTVPVTAVDQNQTKRLQINTYAAVIIVLLVMLVWLLLTQPAGMNFTPSWCYSVSNQTAVIQSQSIFYSNKAELNHS